VQWARRVAKPLNARDVAFVHLVAHERVIAAVLLVRRSGLFTETERASLTKLVPALAVGDALQQASHPVTGGLRTRFECVDGRLTPRQRQVVEHIALGHTNPEIATALAISVHTVRNTLVNVQARLAASNRAEVVHRCVFR
jgi:DNA-binding CsgD family transcriptional regulator